MLLIILFNVPLISMALAFAFEKSVLLKTRFSEDKLNCRFGEPRVTLMRLSLRVLLFESEVSSRTVEAVPLSWLLVIVELLVLLS